MTKKNNLRRKSTHRNFQKSQEAKKVIAAAKDRIALYSSDRG